MPEQTTKMTKEEIIQAIQECVQKLGRVPSQKEAHKMKGISFSMTRRHFGKYSQLMRECKLEVRLNGQRYDTELLLRDWAGVVRKLKQLPTIAGYEQMSKYTETPFRGRFGGWKKVPQGFKRYAMEKGWAEEWKDVLKIIDQAGRTKIETAWMSKPTAEPEEIRIEAEGVMRLDCPVYGEAIQRCPMAYGPTNEAGVIYLFGTLAEKLGFIVMRMQTAFPDCEAMRRVQGKRWQPVRIEFEYESRNFLRHGHDTQKCDLIVCWLHNWEDSPLEVLELRKLVGMQ